MLSNAHQRIDQGETLTLLLIILWNLFTKMCLKSIYRIKRKNVWWMMLYFMVLVSILIINSELLTAGFAIKIFLRLINSLQYYEILCNKLHWRLYSPCKLTWRSAFLTQNYMVRGHLLLRTKILKETFYLSLN